MANLTKSTFAAFGKFWKEASPFMGLLEAGAIATYALWIQSASPFVLRVWSFVADHAVLFSAIAAGLLCVLMFLVATRPTQRLLRYCCFADQPDPWWLAIRATIRLLWIGRHWPTVEHGRIWTETYLLDGEPSRPIRRPGERDEDFAKRTAEFQKERDDWRKRLVERVRAMSDGRLISVDSCDTMISVRKELITYFEYIEEHLNRTGQSAQTLCKVHVEHGFLAPIFLITGLIAAFKEDWEPIVNTYGMQVDDQGRHFESTFVASPGTERDFAAFRLFQFNCWLLWGPSIPICTCKQWSLGEVIAFQFGFGDENNSIEMVTRLDETDWKIRQILASASQGGIAAGGASITGYLKPSKFVQKELCRSQKHLLSESVRGKAPERLAIVIESPRDAVSDLSTPHSAQNFYYSAYIWAMFIVCDATGKPLFPYVPGKGATEDYRWRNLLPFFVHGNIADAATYRRHKYMLARQICGSVRQLLGEHKDLYLRFACALDESACGSATYADSMGNRHGDGTQEGAQKMAEQAAGLVPKDSIRSILAEVVTETSAHDERLRGFVEQGRLRIVHGKDSGAAKGRRLDLDYAACHLPEVIVSYYEQPQFGPQK